MSKFYKCKVNPKKKSMTYKSRRQLSFKVGLKKLLIYLTLCPLLNNF